MIDAGTLLFFAMGPALSDLLSRVAGVALLLEPVVSGVLFLFLEESLEVLFFMVVSISPGRIVRKFEPNIAESTRWGFKM